MFLKSTVTVLLFSRVTVCGSGVLYLSGTVYVPSEFLKPSSVTVYEIKLSLVSYTSRLVSELYPLLSVQIFVSILPSELLILK